MRRAVDPDEFTEAWFAAWNAHDVEAVLAHFHEDAVFTSPYAAQIVPDSRGVAKGKEAIRAYWSTALESNPDLHFEPVNVYVGVQALVINYRNHRGDLVNEVLIFNGDTVIEGHGTYL
ncbi:nuclear transport factor 2 family protein [Mycobacterium sp. NPDC050853]|uniref:nuclear transport factor 2 family protein n=1 Tax=Mycobacteriaceae TaxID=1762 RepID=UPI0015DE5643|nr:nuclear transport factor 2 family protein [Mycobacteroides sp. LB1]